MDFYKPINLSSFSVTPISIGVGLGLGIFVIVAYIRYYTVSGGAAGINRSLLRMWLHVMLAVAIPFGIFFAAKLFLAAADRLTQANLFIAEMIASLMWASVVFYIFIKEYFGRKAAESDKNSHAE
jgi:hypothetical protein